MAIPARGDTLGPIILSTQGFERGISERDRQCASQGFEPQRALLEAVELGGGLKHLVGILCVGNHRLHTGARHDVLKRQPTFATSRHRH